MATSKPQATRKSPAAKPSAKPAAKAPAPRKPARPATKRPARPVVKTAPEAAKVLVNAPAQPKTDKAAKARKPKMIRDSFTMPKAEYAAIDALKARATQAGRPAKKSELLRAGVKLLEGLAPAALVAVLQALPAIKTGRPAKA